MTTSASGITVVTTGALVLLVRLGSKDGQPTVATFVIELLAGARTVNVTLLTAPLGRLPRLQVTSPELSRPPPLAPTKLTLLGRLSVTTTLLAADGPKFVTEIVYVMLLAARTVDGPDLPTAKSDCRVTAVTTGGVVLFSMFVSNVGEPTLATFVKVPLAGAVTVTVRLLPCPAAMDPRLQLTAPELFEPPPLAPTNITPAGKVSVTTTLLALDGPKFVTVIV